MDDDRRKEFHAWILRQWSAWDRREGQRSTQAELAEYLGVTRSAVAQYVTGRQVPDRRHLAKIAARFGSEVYDVLGMTPPPDDFSLFPPGLAERLRGARAELEEILNSGVAPGSSEHARRTLEVLERYGFTAGEIEIKANEKQKDNPEEAS